MGKLSPHPSEPASGAVWTEQRRLMPGIQETSLPAWTV